MYTGKDRADVLKEFKMGRLDASKLFPLSMHKALALTLVLASGHIV